MPAPITINDILDELRRELAMRQRVYPTWVQKETIKPETAARRIEVLKAAILRLEETMSWAEMTAPPARSGDQGRLAI